MSPSLPEGSTMATPLAPSVEKAYYRKCIELKRRLNEVETANDEAKLRRIRLDRSIMKMRLERAFLLEQLSKRMELDIDNSDASGDEQISTPPPDRPHRDKKRKPEDAMAPSPVVKDGGAPRTSPPGSPSLREDSYRINIDRGAGVVGEAVGTGPSVHTDANQQRRIIGGGDGPF